MAKFTKLNIGEAVASSGGKAFKRLSAEVILPLGYRLLEYIESSGTQYIDTGYKPNNNTRVVAKLQCTQFLGDYTWIFGARTTSSTDMFGLRIRSDDIYDTLYGDASPLGFSGLGNTALLNIDMNKNVHTLNNIRNSKSATTFQTAYPIILFGLNNGGSIAKTKNIRFYSFNIYDNDVLIRQLVPCINPNNEVGMYDFVTKSFFANAGTGVFAYAEPAVTSNFTLADGSVLLTVDGQIFTAKEN